MRVIGLLTCLCLCQWSQALATDPSPAASAATQAPPAAAADVHTAAPASAPSPSTAAAVTSAATTAATPDQGVPAAVDKELRAQGFKKEVRNNVTYYCRRETILGSHFEQKSCRTAERIAAEHTTARAVMERAQIETMQTAKP
jgi:hypothetical protein